ncbi:MAG: glycosyltransferase family 1 protein, partial [Desulfuromonas sp.]
MKVCLFNSCRTWGGGEKWHLDAAMALAAPRFHVLAGVHPGSDLQKRLVDAGIESRAFTIGNLSLLNPVRLGQLYRWFRTEAVETVILNLPSDLKVAGVAARLAGVPRIIYRRGSAIPVRNTLLNRWLFRHVVTDVIANSKETKQTILARNSRLIDPSRIRVIYNGIDPADYLTGPPTARTGTVDDPLVLGTAGRLSRQKNQVFLLETLRRLQQRGLHCRLLIAGTGPLRTELEEEARRLGVAASIEFLGFVEDMSGFLSQIDVFLLSSLWEGFGYVLTEAMACARPIVAFDHSSNPEVVVQGETGLLTDPGDVEAFCDAVAHLASHPELRGQMGAAG